MAKAKGNAGVQNKAIYSRASYLYQAATYLASRADAADDADSKAGDDEAKALRNLSRRALADMRAVTLKAQIRQGAALKRSVCKRCDTLQVEGRTCGAAVENASRGGRAPWADVLVVRCRACGLARRFPVQARRRKKKGGEEGTTGDGDEKAE